MSHIEAKDDGSHLVRTTYSVLLDTKGQSTVEYALVLFAFLAIVVALSRVVSYAGDGRLYATIIGSGSHSLEGDVLSVFQDVLLY